MRRPLIAREGWGIIGLLAGLTLLAGWLQPWLAAVPGVLLALSLWFFRDPERRAEASPRDVLAPADGRVLWVREVEEPRYLGGKAIAVSIFLSIFDVHVNRAPVAGRVGYKEYVPGKFRAAWAEGLEEVNERAYLGIEGPDYRVLVVQIAGLVARRIRTWVEVGDYLSQGQRFGMILFGSCTQVYLPLGATVTVRPGDRVVAGRTIIGRLPE
ncbi:MAG: phosphatidylserine decarboxylase family protein [Bacillota bacterium]